MSGNALIAGGAPGTSTEAAGALGTGAADGVAGVAGVEGEGAAGAGVAAGLAAFAAGFSAVGAGAAGVGAGGSPRPAGLRGNVSVFGVTGLAGSAGAAGADAAFFSSSRCENTAANLSVIGFSFVTCVMVLSPSCLLLPDCACAGAFSSVCFGAGCPGVGSAVSFGSGVFSTGGLSDMVNDPQLIYSLAGASESRRHRTLSMVTIYEKTS